MTVLSDLDPCPSAPTLSDALLSDTALSGPVVRLVVAVEGLRAQVPGELPGGLALAEAGVVLRELERLTAIALARVADVDARGLFALAGSPSTGSWVQAQPVGVSRDLVALARKLDRVPLVAAAVAAGVVSLPSAVLIGQALDRVRRHVDRPDGTIDGQDGEQVLTAVIVDGVSMLVGQGRGGWDSDDPALPALRARLVAVAGARAPAVERLERAFLLLAEQLTEPALVSGALGQLVDAVLPVQFEDRVERAHRDRGLQLRRNSDGSGWTIAQGRLDLECGELLFAVLTAQRATDPANPADTAGWAAARAAEPHDPAGWVAAAAAGELPTDHTGDAGDPAGGDPAGCDPGGGDLARYGLLTAEQARYGPGPRSVRQQAHDALKLGLRRLLASDALGRRDKTTPQLAITVSLAAVHGEPGALPGTAGSGMTVPGSLVRRVLCDSRITRFVLGLGGRVLETSHTERTLKAHERAALHLRWGGRCAGAGCTTPPGSPLVPHHATPWHTTGTTSLSDSVPLCDTTHHDLHTGGKTIRLRDGRYLTPHGWHPTPEPDP